MMNLLFRALVLILALAHVCSARSTRFGNRANNLGSRGRKNGDEERVISRVTDRVVDKLADGLTGKVLGALKSRDRLGNEVCDEQNRCWYVYVPPKVMESEDMVPMLVELHPYTKNKKMKYTGWQQKAEDNGMILVRPIGKYFSWNGGACCGVAAAKNYDDVTFLRKVVQETIKAQPKLDGSQVYFTGHSNGCGMAQRMAAEASDIVTAVACHALWLGVEKSDNYVPVPVMEIHGLHDNVVPYHPMEGGIRNRQSRRGIKEIAQKVVGVLQLPKIHSLLKKGDTEIGIGAKGNIQKWAEYNECEGKVETIHEGYSEIKYINCKNEATVVLLSYFDGNHQPFGSVMGPKYDSTQLAYDFMIQYKN